MEDEEIERDGGKASAGLGRFEVIDKKQYIYLMDYDFIDYNGLWSERFVDRRPPGIRNSSQLNSIQVNSTQTNPSLFTSHRLKPAETPPTDDSNPNIISNLLSTSLSDFAPNN
jgi:hypothetical protein